MTGNAGDGVPYGGTAHRPSSTAEVNEMDQKKIAPAVEGQERKAAWAKHRQRLNENLPGVTYRGGFSVDRKPPRTPEGADGRLPYGMAMLVQEAEARPFLDNCRLRVERLLQGRL